MRRAFVGSMIRRELRTAGKRFGLYGSCMAIGIAVVVGLYSLREAVDEAVDLQSRELLGADLRLESRTAFDDPSRAAVAALDALDAMAEAKPTEITRLGSMALAESSGESRLVDLLAVDGRFPLYGEVWTEPAHLWSSLGEDPTRLFVDASLLLQLDVRVGDRLRIGGQSFEIAASVRKAPGSVGIQAEIAPRVYLARAGLDRTELLQEGSLAEYQRFYEVPAQAAEQWVSQNEGLLEEARIRFETVRSHQEDLSAAFETLTRYLALVGLAALVLGSIGVAAGIRVFIREKLETVALLRSIGTTPREVVAIYAGLAICLGLAAGLLGILLCLPLVAILPSLLEDLLPVEIVVRISPGSMLMGIGLAVWATLLCAVGPVLDLARVSPLRAIRRDFSTEADSQSGRVWVGVAVLASLVVASIAQAGSWRVGLGFSMGLLATVASLTVSALGSMRLLRRHPFRGLAYWARQGIANLFRPRNHTLPTTLAIGFALFVVATLHSVQQNVLDQLAIDTRPDRPNFVLFDVQRDQVEGVVSLLEERNARIVDEAPLVSARLSGAGGKSRASWLAEEDLSKSKRWALQREYRLTYSDELRDSEILVEGEWWSASDERAPGAPVPISLEKDLADSLEVEIGDSLRWQIQGVEIETTIQNLREVDWGRMATNFFVVFPVEALEDAPQSRVLLAHLADEKARAELQRDLVRGYPNVSALDATLILRSVDTMLSQIAMAVQVLSFFMLGTGLAILVAASLAARGERARETALLRVLGASRPVLRRIAATEAFALAGLAVVVGGGLAAVAAWIIVVFFFELPFDPPVIELIGLAVGTFLLTAVFGSFGASGVLTKSPQSTLREESG